MVAALADDELGPSLVGEYLKLVYSPAPRFVEDTLTRNRHWCDDVRTPRAETCEEQAALALERALAELAAEHGADVRKWRWGAAHRATFAHAFLTHVPLVRRWADLSIESDGGDSTVNAGTTPQGRPGDSFGHVDGAGFRAVYDLANLADSRFIIATGQSGNPLSPHYGDFLERWRDGQYIRIAGDRDSVVRTGLGRLVLVPAVK